MSNPSPDTPLTKPHGLFHNIFDVVVVLKGLNGFVEIACGATLLSVKAGTVMELVQWLTQSELLQDPHDLLANALEHWAMNFGHDAQVLAGLYLLVHGIVKFTLAILLFKERPWVFPLALVLFTTLVAFLLHQLWIHWSWALAVFIVFDVFTIGVIAKEWRMAVNLRSLQI